MTATIYKIQAQDAGVWKDLGVIVDYGNDAAVRINHGLDLTTIQGSDYQSDDSVQGILDQHFDPATVATSCSHFGCPVRVSQTASQDYTDGTAAEVDADARYNALFPPKPLGGGQ